MRITIQNGNEFKEIGIQYEGKALSVEMHETDVLRNTIQKPFEVRGWESEYQFEIQNFAGISSWLVVNRNYVGDELEVYWVDDVGDDGSFTHKKNVGDVFKIGRGVIGTIKDLREYMCSRYVNRTQIGTKTRPRGVRQWVNGGNNVV